MDLEGKGKMPSTEIPECWDRKSVVTETQKIGYKSSG